MSVILALRRPRQEDVKFKVSLGYLMTFEATLDYTPRLSLKNKLKLSVQCLLSFRDPLKRTESDAKVTCKTSIAEGGLCQVNPSVSLSQIPHSTRCSRTKGKAWEIPKVSLAIRATLFSA